MLEFGKLTSPSLKTSRESCCVKSLNCCSQLQLQDCENHPKYDRTATPEALFLRNVVFLGRIPFILPQTWLMGTVWHTAVSRGGTVMDLLGTQLENLVAQDKAMTLWWDRTWQECHRS